MTFGTLRHAEGAWTIEAEPHVVLKLKRVFPKVPRKAHGIIAGTGRCTACGWSG